MANGTSIGNKWISLLDKAYPGGTKFTLDIAEVRNSTAQHCTGLASLLCRELFPQMKCCLHAFSTSACSSFLSVCTVSYAAMRLRAGGRRGEDKGDVILQLFPQPGRYRVLLRERLQVEDRKEHHDRNAA